MEYFFSNVYPSQPVIHRQGAQDIIMSIEHSIEAYCMIAALCAYVMIQSNMTVSPDLLQRQELAQMTNVGIGQVLLDESVAARKGLNYLEHPTHLSVLTSWFYYGCYFGLGWDNTAWSYLREATTQAQLLGMHDEEIYKNDPLDISRRRVLYWLLFVTERYGAGELTIVATQSRYCLAHIFLTGHMLFTNIDRLPCIRQFTHRLWMRCLQTDQSPWGFSR